MADTKIWEIEDDTGKVYKVEGPMDATPDELFQAVGSMAFPKETAAKGLFAPEATAQDIAGLNVGDQRPAAAIAPNAMLQNNPDQEVATKALQEIPGAREALDKMVRSDMTFEQIRDTFKQQFNGVDLPEGVAPNQIAAIRADMQTPEGAQYWSHNSTAAPVNRPTGVADINKPDTLLGEFGQSAERSLANMANTVTGAVGLGADLVGADETAETLLDEYLNKQAAIAQNFPSSAGHVTDIENVGDAARIGVSALGELLPQITASLGAGAVGGAVARKVAEHQAEKWVEEKVAEGYTREAAQAVAARYLKKDTMIGQIAGAGASSEIQETGSVYGDTYGATGERKPWQSLLAGTAAASLDSVLPARILKKIGGDVVEDVLVASLYKKLGKEGAVQFLMEGGTEGLQTVIEGLPAGKAIDWNEVIDATVRGGFGGAVAGVATQGVQELRTPKATVAEAEAPAAPATIVAPTAKKRTAAYRQQIADTSKAIDTHIKSITEGWENGPSYEVHDNFSKLKGIDNNAIGAIHDGKVVINSEALVKEAERSDRTTDAIATAVTFHEGLGHHGMSQVFGEALDTKLQHILDNSSVYKARAEKWLKKNPKAYENDPNREVRALDEILAELSEKGPLPASVVSQFKNEVKDFARKMGVNWNYSTREVEAILAKAHKATMESGKEQQSFLGPRYKLSSENDIESATLDDGTTIEILKDKNGKWLDTMNHRGPSGAELPGDMKPSVRDIESGKYPVKGVAPKAAAPTRREQIVAASQALADTKNGETKTIRPFPEDEPDYHRFRHVTEDGKPVTGTYTVEGDKIANFSIGSDGGAGSIGAKAVRQIGRDLIKAHPEVSGVDGFRISGARKDAEFVSIGNRYMMMSDPDKVEMTPEEIANMSPDELFESQNAMHILEQMTKGYTPVVMSYDDLEKEAQARNLPPSRILRNNSIGAGEIVKRLYMYDIAMDKMHTKVTNLWAKIQTGNYTQAEKATYLKTVFKMQELIGRIFEDQGEVGRALAAMKAIQFTARRVKGVKATLDQFDVVSHLDDEEAFFRFAQAIQADIDSAAENKRSKAQEIAANALNLPRALMSSIDLSAPLRQGIFLIHKAAWWNSFFNMFRYAGSKSAFDDLMESITVRPSYKHMVKSRLALSNMNDKLAAREEAFMSSWAEKIPGIGRLVRGSERAYVGFLNKLRADVFDRLAGQLPEDASEQDFKDIATFINAASGRGNLPKSMNGAVPLLNSIFFSPRLIASRLKMTTVLADPRTYTTMNKVARKEYIKSILTVGATALLVTSLLTLGGAEVEKDPRSSDFGKARFGDTRYDILGGEGQYIVLAARLYSKAYKTTDGVVKKYGNKFGQPNREDAIFKFGTNKLAPVPSFVMDYLRGVTTTGEKFSADQAVMSRFVPMFAQDVMEVVKTDGLAKGVAKSAPGLFGVGVQNYSKPSLDTEKEIDSPDSFKKADMPDGDYSKDGLDYSALDGVVTLGDKAEKEWNKRVNFYYKEWLKDETSKPEWKKLPDDDRRKIISEVRKDARKEAKLDMVDLLGIEEETDTEE